MGIAVGVPVLAVSVVACSGGSDGAGDGGKKNDAREERSSGGSAGKSGGGEGGGSGGGESAEGKRLASALLKSGDVAGYRVQRSKKDALPRHNTVQSDDPKCSAVTDAMDSDPEHARTAYTNGVLQKGSSPASSGAVQQVLLASYKKDGAQQWLAELRKALGGCKSFTAKDGAGEKVRLNVARGPVGAVGDDSVEFTLRVTEQRDSPLVFTIVRTGGRTASFMSISLSGEPRPIAKALAVKQHEKLAALGRG
ncbi:sensor domain-containing protein [Streptomyces ovatisporus]|uniref:Sensor domain-containing protein n=1 Tax=Streptomyces ovatisporus TaxID=1128682 RepID=A0ABV9A3S0_9ACTN